MNILFFHGFNASPWDVKACVQVLRDNGHRVRIPTMHSFALHGETYSSTEDWLAEAQQVLENFAASCNGSLALAGHSLGGVICAHLLTGDIREDLRRRIVKVGFLATAAGIDRECMQFWQSRGSTRVKWPFGLQVQMFSFLKDTDSKFSEIAIPSIVLTGGRDHHIAPNSGPNLAAFLGKQCVGLFSAPCCDHFFPASDDVEAASLHRKLADFFNNQDRNDHDNQ